MSAGVVSMSACSFWHVGMSCLTLRRMFLACRRLALQICHFQFRPPPSISFLVKFLISSFLHVGAWLLACRLVLYMSAKDFVLPCRHAMLTMSACGRGGRGGRLYKAAALASRSTSSTSTCPRCAAKWAGVSPLLLQLGSLLNPKPLNPNP